MTAQINDRLGFHEREGKCFRSRVYHKNEPFHLPHTISLRERIPQLCLAFIIIVTESCGRDTIVSCCYRASNDCFKRCFTKDCAAVVVVLSFDYLVFRAFVIQDLPDNSSPPGQNAFHQ